MNSAAIHLLFDSSFLLREADKPALADASWNTCGCEAPVNISEDCSWMVEHFFQSATSTQYM